MNDVLLDLYLGITYDLIYLEKSKIKGIWKK